jgi:hypothetical protein
VLKRIAEATGVAAEEYSDVVQAIHQNLNYVLHHWLWFQSLGAMESSGHSIRPVLQAARSLRDALRNLDENGRIALQAQIGAVAFDNAKKGEARNPHRDSIPVPLFGETGCCGSYQVEQLETYEEMAGDLMAAAKKAVEFRLNAPIERTRREHGTKSRGGAPKGPRHHELQLLVLHLRRAIEEVGKGRLTYDRVTGGSLVQVLEELRPYVKFIPSPLPMRALQEMTRRKTRQKK